MILGREIVTTHRTRDVHCDSREGDCKNSQDLGTFIVILERKIVTTHRTRDVHCDSREGDCNS